MIVQLTNSEFQELRNSIIKAKNPILTRYFNNIFKPDNNLPVKGFSNPLNKDIIIELDEDSVIKFQKIITSHSYEICKAASGGVSLSAAPKYFAIAKRIFEDLTRVFKIK